MTQRPLLVHRSLAPADRQHRLIGLSLVASPIVAAHWLAHSHQTSPLICPFHWLTGLPCPGCGLTRSFVAIARGDWPGAIGYHPFGPLLFGALLGLGLQWAVELWARRRLVWPIGRSLRQAIGRGLLILGLVWYSARLYGLWGSGAAALAWSRSPLGQWLGG